MTLLIAALSLCFNENEKITTISLREIMPQDFSGKNLRGRNFKGQNLTGAKFIGADIRGANFTNAILREADFTRAKAGLQRRWTIFLVTLSLFLSAIWGLMSCLTTVFLALLFRLDNIKEHTSVILVLFLIVLLIFWIVTISQGVVAGAVAGVATAALAMAAAGAVAVALAMAAVLAFAAAVAAAGVLAATATVTGVLAVKESWLQPVKLTGVVAMTVAMTVAVTMTSLMTSLMIVPAGQLGIYIARRALAGHEKHRFVRSIAMAFATTGGTSFRNADLTDANFTEATVKSTDFRKANLTRTCFHNIKKLDREFVIGY